LEEKRKRTRRDRKTEEKKTVRLEGAREGGLVECKNKRNKEGWNDTIL
jgi:hypothetical protein